MHRWICRSAVSTWVAVAALSSDIAVTVFVDAPFASTLGVDTRAGEARNPKRSTGFARRAGVNGVASGQAGAGFTRLAHVTDF